MFLSFAYGVTWMTINDSRIYHEILYVQLYGPFMDIICLRQIAHGGQTPCEVYPSKYNSSYINSRCGCCCFFLPASGWVVVSFVLALQEFFPNVWMNRKKFISLRVSQYDFTQIVLRFYSNHAAKLLNLFRIKENIWKNSKTGQLFSIPFIQSWGF